MPTKVELNLALDAGEVKPIWTFGGNTCHMTLWLRDDIKRQLAMVHDELGFKYVRCHGGLNDDMDVVRGDGSFHFDRIDEALDGILAIGLKPFFELSSMPKALARADTHICHYEFMNAPPKDWNSWYELIRALTEHLREKYGPDEVRTWYFEVWNEPDIGFWEGTQEEYFRLYDLAARAVKGVDPEFRIGGPATARTRWIDEFTAHVTKGSPSFDLDCARCDFVSTHAYPSDIEFCDSDVGGVSLTNSNILQQLFGEARSKVDAGFGSGFPMLCGEWNSSAGPLMFNHDECNNAAFVAKALHELSSVCDGSLYWNISDIYEECGFHYTPFHGGYGLITVNDIRKSTFHAFRMLRAHSGKLVATTSTESPDGFGCLASQDGGELRMLAYYYKEPDADASAPITIELAGLPANAQSAVVERVLPGHGSAYETWLAMGSPDYMNRSILDALEAASVPESATVDLAATKLELPQGTLMQITIPGVGITS